MIKAGQRRNFYLALHMLVAVLFVIQGISLAQGTLATLEGVITDDEDHNLVGATITVRNVESGYTNSAISQPDGRYIISGLPPGKYEVEVSLDGFITQKRLGMTFNVGAKINISFKLIPATVHEEVLVTADVPMVEVSKSEISNIVNRDKIEDLPLVDRDFSQLLMLKAGVQPGGDQFWRRDNSDAQPRGMTEVLIDGVSNERTIEGRPKVNLPADAIQEFRIYTNQFEAELGNSVALLTSIITRSGTNQFRGRASFFYRDEMLDDVNYFVNHAAYGEPELPKDQWEKSDYKHNLFGGFLGGPIVKDKAHFFIAFSRLMHTEYATITSPLVPRETVPIETNNNQIFVKLDYQLNEKNRLMSRFSYSRPDIKNFRLGGFETKERALHWVKRNYDLQLNWTYYPSSNSMNEVRILYGDEDNPITETNPDAYSIIRPSGRFGSPYNYPAKSGESRTQLIDNFSVFLNKHSLKFGVDASFIPFYSDGANYVPGEWVFATDEPFDPNNPDTYPLSFSYAEKQILAEFTTTIVGLFIQDAWKVTPQLTLNLGLRFNYYHISERELDTWNIRHINPRLAFSWDPKGDGKTAIRGGIGTFSANPVGNQVGGNIKINQMILKTIMYPNYPDPFIPNPFFPSSVKDIPPPFVVRATGKQIAPYSLQTTLGLQREIIEDLAVSVDLVWTRGYHQWSADNINDIIPGTGNQRPDPTQGDVIVQGDRGKSDYKALYFNLNKRYSHGWSLDVAYALSRSWQDTWFEWDGPWYYSSEPNFWNRMYGPTATDARHSLVVTGIFDLPFGFQFSGLLRYHSAFPWNAKHAGDLNKDGKSGDWVDQHRNSRRGFDYMTINARISKFINAGPIKLQVLAEAYNLTNRTNFTSIYTVYGRPAFGNPVRAASPRQFQIGARLDF